MWNKLSMKEKAALIKVAVSNGYISEDNQKYLSRELGVSLAEIYDIITFY